MTHRTIVIAAPGPSLELRDCMIASDRAFLMTVNSAIFFAPFAHAVYAGDSTWWRVYNRFLDGWYAGLRLSCSQAAPEGVLKLQRSVRPGAGVWGNNSGVQAIAAAMNLYWPDRVLLLGFDCRWPSGRKHVHGGHPETYAGELTGCIDPMSPEAWISDHAKMAKLAPVEIVNCSRDTALDCYPTGDLEDELLRSQP